MAKATQRKAEPAAGLFSDAEAKPAAAQPETAAAAAPKPEGKPARQKKAQARRAPPVAQAAPAASKAVAIREAEPKSMLAVIAAAASNPAVDVAKMQALLDMQERLQADQSRRDFIAAFMALSTDLPAIRADGKIEIREKDASGKREGRLQQATPYATFQNIYKTIKPLLQRHGFTLSFATEPSADGIRIIVKTFLDHAGGHQRTSAFPLPAETSGSKNNVQGWGSAMSYGKRYGTIAVLNIISYAAADADLDGAKVVKGDPETVEGEVVAVALITQDQQDKLIESIEDCGVGRKKFCERYKIDKVGDLPAAAYAEALKACATYKENQQAKRQHG